jgi:hypothetical protein
MCRSGLLSVAARILLEQRCYARDCLRWRIGNALRLKLHGAAAAFEDRAGCFDITLPAIVANDSIMADAHESRREDMQAETPDELQGAEGFPNVFFMNPPLLRG